jgi:UDP-N-acetylglucosamine 4,6-dehydratase
MEDSRRTLYHSNRYVVVPVQADWGYNAPVGEFMKENLAYRSDTNDQWVTKDQIAKILKELD